MDSKKLGQAMSLIERTYHNGDMRYWFEEAPELYAESSYDSDEFDDKFPIVLAETYQQIFEENGMDIIDDALDNFLYDKTLLAELVKEASNAKILEALKTMQEYITPKHKSYRALQKIIYDTEILPLQNIKCTLEVMSKYMLDVKNFGAQSNSYGTIGKLVSTEDPSEFQKYHLKAKISPTNLENCGSRGIAILFKFIDNKVMIDFDIVNQQFLNSEQTVVGFGRTVRHLMSKEYDFTNDTIRDKKNLKEIVCHTLEDCRPYFKEYVKENPDGSPIPYEGK